MFSKILIANRGEVAVRIIRACKEMGIQTVAVYSEADQNALHVALADEHVCIGPAPAVESYLNQNNILAAALATKAQAIHPGYGFLSENAVFAQLCSDYGVVFIGPKASVIEQMGDKNNARRLMKQAGVPIVPGSEVVRSVQEARQAAADIGYPLLIKASAGGGGKGIRLVTQDSELEAAFLTASSEAKKAFDNGDVYLEKFMTGVRHVEMQVLADERGHVVCLGERDCSLQRNKQKVIEETPSPAVGPELRRSMEQAAMLAVQAAHYTNAGTVEFLLEPNGRFYFIEMNTRLQVEHGVTEEVSNVDIVKWQIRIACKMPLPFSQEDIQLEGCAIECRINAQSTGTVDFLHLPGYAKVHFDTALVQDCEIVPFYDSMIGKLIVHSSTREEAIRKMEAALCETVIHGVQTNIESQLQIIRNAQFKAGRYDTAFLQKLDEGA